MVTTFLAVFILLTVLYTLIDNLLQSKVIKEEASDENDNDFTKVKLIPLPTLPGWKTLPWLALFGQMSVTNLLRYIQPQFKVVAFTLWNIRIVFVNDLKLGRELFKNPTFSAKSRNDTCTFFSKGSNGVINTSNQVWKGQRKFCYQHLKDLGLGTKSMESKIHKEIEDLIQIWRDKKGELFLPNKDFYMPILSIIWILLTGERATAQDKELVHLVNCAYKDVGRYFAFPEAILIALKLKQETVDRIVDWIPIFPGFKSGRKTAADLWSYFERIVYERKTLVLEEENSSNFVDAYLKKIHKTTDPKSEFYGEKGETHLLAAMVDFFMAGGDTVANTLAWAMLNLIRNPDIQTKIRDEIDLVMEGDRLPSLHDRQQCPFTEAFLLEVLRCHPIAACSLPHVPAKNKNIGPYYIEEGTIILLNIYGINHDTDIWGDPDNFRPERFLSPDGKSVVRNDAMCSFSVGLRRCVGEQSAKDNLFLFVSAICQRFILKPDPHLEELPPLTDNKSGLHTPKTFSMVAIERKKD